MNDPTILLWLDDVRFPPTDEWKWVKTADEAITVLATGKVLFASLDHDLLPEHYPWALGYDWNKVQLTSGFKVTLFLRKGTDLFLPPDGVRVHSMNLFASNHMLNHIEDCYRHQDFQCSKNHEVLPWNLTGQPAGWAARNTTYSMILRYEGARHSS